MSNNPPGQYVPPERRLKDKPPIVPRPCRRCMANVLRSLSDDPHRSTNKTCQALLTYGNALPKPMRSLGTDFASVIWQQSYQRRI
jgi:hypothetical protein